MSLIHSETTGHRMALIVEYLGSKYAGWQRQEKLETIQERIEQALSKVADSSITVTCAGRTDAGVHARGQVIHFDTIVSRPLVAWVLGVNAYLPQDIRVVHAQPVSLGFHARFSALQRRYRYTIDNRSVPSALEYAVRTFYPRRLNEKIMHEAAQSLLGEQDFSAVRAANCQSNSPYRCVTQARVWREGDLVYFEIAANAFLYHMVRNIVGSLLWVGTGYRPLSWMSELLASKDRTQAGKTAPPQGLCLEEVTYPVSFGFGKTVISTVNV